MAVSFSAEYLYQGTKFLSRGPMTGIEGEQNGFQCPEAVYIVARAVYSLGVVVIAPIGILYHEAAKGICYAQTFLPGRNIVELERLMREYDRAISCDSLAWFTSLSSVVFTVLVVVGVYFQAYAALGMALAIPALAFLLAWADEIPVADLFLTYNYATLPACFTNYLHSVEQLAYYGAYYLYNGLVRAGIAVDQPLTWNEIGEFDRIRGRVVREEVPYQVAVHLYTLLLGLNKVMPAWQARVQAFVDRTQDINSAWEAARTEPSQPGETLVERRARFLTSFSQRVQPILAALPPVGAPVPAAAARA